MLKHLCTGLGLLIFSLYAEAQEPFIALPNAKHYFDGKIKSTDQDLNLLVTRFDMPGLGDDTTTLDSNTNNGDSSNNPNNPINNLINSNIVKQLGVGVQIHF